MNKTELEVEHEKYSEGERKGDRERERKEESGEIDTKQLMIKCE